MSVLRPLSSTAAVVTLLAALAACGSDDPSSTAATDPGAGAATPSGAPGGVQPPGAFGEIAAADGKTLQVQGQAGQVAVTWTAETDITQQVAAALSDVSAGSCVVVGATDQEEDASTVTATSVRISPPVDGSCQGGFGGDRPAGGPGGAPSGMPSGMPSGAPGGAAGPGGGAFGQVTAVTADGFTVESAPPGADAATTITVTVAADTTYSTSATADGSALEVGRCVQATGDADSTGAVTATRISVTDPVDGSCLGFGGFGGQGRPA